MAFRQRVGNLVDCEPLDLGQARLLVHASPAPVLIADVVGDGFSVLAVDPLLRRFITGAVHPSGPRPGEIIAAAGFGMLGPTMAAVASTGEAVTTELPIGDEPRWFELSVSPIVAARRCTQVIILGADRTADHNDEHRQRRARHRYQAMVDHVPGLVLLVDSAARIVRSSSGIGQALMGSADTRIGRQIFELVHLDDVTIAAETFGRVLGAPGQSIATRNLRVERSDGSIQWCDVVATNLLHDDDIAAVVVNLADVTERRMAEQQLQLISTTDSTTGLGNRRGLEVRLHRRHGAAPSPESTLGVLAIQLDGIGSGFDRIATEAIDAAVCVVAERLAALADARSDVARTGVTSFHVLVGPDPSGERAAHLATAIHEVLREPVDIEGVDRYLRASIGTSRTGGQASMSEVLHQSDLALAAARQLAPGRTVAFTSALAAEVQQRQHDLRALTRAVHERKLRLVHQPILDSSGHLIGTEALLRWDRGGELVAPDAFLALAEETGLIGPIGAWVLDRACHDLAELRGRIGRVRWVSVNVSVREVFDERLPLLLHRAMEDYGIEPGGLVLEISEDALVDDRIDATLAQLGAARIVVACADLATDQRVLDSLSRLPIAALKLDRGLVGQLDVDTDGSSRAMVAAIVELAAAFDVEVTAQGVETARQADALTELDVELRQGFHLVAPIELDELIRRLRD